MFLLLLSVLAASPLVRPEPLSVVPDDWRPRSREVRGARRISGLRLDGDRKKHGEPGPTCPDYSKIYPCKCKQKTKSLDITCEEVSVKQLVKAASGIKESYRDRKVELNIGYFRIRHSSMHRLPDYVFMGLNIVHLLIYNSNLSALMPNSLSSLARSLRHLVLSNNNLQAVPTEAMRQLRNLDHVNLGQNNISVIEDGSFWGLNKVTRLTLYDNKIHRIHKEAFASLQKDLLRLNLVRNMLTEVPVDALLPLKNLNQLNLSENKITKIQPNTFIGMDKLDKLDLNHNLLTEVGQSYFEGLPRLTTLNIDYNKITKIEPRAFKGLEENLQSLSITHNKLDSLPSHALRPLHQLTTLHLDDNKVDRIQSDAFQGYGEHIKNLWLQNNHIEIVEDEAFEDLHSLEWLKLWNNQLTTLHYELMEPVLDTLKHLDIHSNPLVCDCEMRWYKKWYNDEWQDVDEDHIKNTTCFNPADNKDHAINKVDMHDMFCARGTQTGGARALTGAGARIGGIPNISGIFIISSNIYIIKQLISLLL